MISTSAGDPLAGAVFQAYACSAADDSICGWLARATGSETAARVAAFALGTPLFVAIVVAAALVLRWVAQRAIRRTVERVIGGDGRGRGFVGGSIDLLERADPVSAIRRSQRARAIGSLLASSVTVVVWVLALLVVLPEVGVQVGGLIAGAGIVGLTLAFGAQTLISDLVSGIFMIAEDQFGVGDVVDMGEASGIVESVGLRTTRLRAVDGTVWHVRNGEVKRVGNMSQGWSRVVLDLEISYSEDVDAVTRVLAGLGRTFREDPEFGPKTLEDPEIWGIEAFTDDALVIRMIIKTEPLEQWAVAREMRRRIKDAFDDAGIDFRHGAPGVRVGTEGPVAQTPPTG